MVKHPNAPYKFHRVELSSADGLGLKPVKIGNVPKMAVLLGLMGPKLFDIYENCDGKRDIRNIGQVVQLTDDQVRIYVDKLVKSKMVQL